MTTEEAEVREPKTCPHCGSGDIEDCPVPARKVIMWFCNCCGRGWTEKET